MERQFSQYYSVPSYSVEQISPHQLAVVARIHAQCFSDCWDELTLKKILQMPGSFGFVARSPRFDSVIGFALCRVSADQCELLSLGVARDYRKQGIATTLMRSAMAMASSQKARWFFLEVAIDNDAAARLYEALGLKKVGVRPNYYENKDGTRTDANTMRADLAKYMLSDI